jgi:hypothetical protein
VPPDNFWARITRVASSIFKEEVKTPLSFYFRVAILVPVVLGAILLVSATNDFKLQVLVLSLGFLLVLCVLVAIFAWWRPKHLVFGESGHRAELRLEYGTDERILTRREVATIEGVQAPKELAQGEVK